MRSDLTYGLVIAATCAFSMAYDEVYCLRAEEGISQSACHRLDWGGVTNDLQLAIATDKESYVRGEPVSLTVSIRNAGDPPVPVVDGSIVEIFDVRVMSPTNRRSPMSLYGKNLWDCRISGSGRWLCRNQTHTSELEDLCRCYDMTLAGTYTITVGYKSANRSGGTDAIETLSNTITVTLVDR